MHPNTITIANNAGTVNLTICEVTISSFPAIWLNNGNNAQAANTAMIAARRVIITDSAKNWAMRYLRGDPSTLRTPTSRARFADRAVERFMKFIQAISNMNKAMAEKI